MTYSPALETDVVRPGPDALAPSSLHLLSTAPAARSQKQVRLAVVLVSLVTFLIGLPFVRVQLPGVAGFIPAYEGALWTIDVVTAALIFGQFIQSRSRALLVLGAGYVFDALIVVPHALTFPGAFTPTGLLWAGPQTTAWLYHFWHGGFPLFVLAYALLPRGEADRIAGDPARGILAACAMSIALVAALTFIATAGHDQLPPIMQDLDYTRAVRRGVGPVVWALTALALAALWLRKTPTSLDVWLSVAFVAWLLDVAFAAVIGAHRFDFGFYAGRIYGLMAASYVLVMLLIETYGLYGKLADAVKRLETKTEELQAVLDTAPAGIWFTDGPAASRIWSNRWGAEYLRLPSGVRASLTAPLEAIPTHYKVYSANVPIATEDLPLQKAARGVEVRDAEHELRFDDGEVRHLLANAAPLRDRSGRLRGAVVVGVDVTARRKAEEAARERELLQTIVDRIPVMITVYEPDTKLLTVNRAFSKTTGWPSDDIHGVSLMEEFYPDPEYRSQVQAFMDACREGWMDIRMRRRDDVVLDTTWANIRLADGRHVGIGIDISERKRSEEQRLLLLNELNHRVKNTLATVQSLAMQTMRGALDPQEAFLRFEARLGALARAHDVLTGENWEGAELRTVIERALEPFQDGRGRFRLIGERARLAPQHALALAMALHELATNAVKYGSLSNDEGEVEIEWRPLAEKRVVLVWRERNGPPVRPAVRKGFGSRLLERSLAHDLGAAAELDFPATGAVATITAPCLEI